MAEYRKELIGEWYVEAFAAHVRAAEMLLPSDVAAAVRATHKQRVEEERKRKEEQYDLSDGYVEVQSGPAGMPTIWDYDIVIMMISHLTEAMDRFREGRGPMPGRTWRPHVADILKFCQRGDGGNQASSIEAALDRLRGTSVKIERKNRDLGTREVMAEGLLSSYRILSRTRSGKIDSVEIEVPRWLYSAITASDHPDVLNVDPAYFEINSGLGRFVYRLARLSAGRGSSVWSFLTVHERSGGTNFREFCRILRALLRDNNLPGYHLEERKGRTGPLLVMVRSVT